MSNIELLTTALSFLEDNLTEKITTEDVAKACYCSKSTLEKLFRCVNNISVRDYIIRRRMTKAAKLLLTNKELSILDVALEYGYNSNEAFTRAFKQVWNCKPSEYRAQNRYLELFPRLQVSLTHGEQSMKKVDISQLYDLFKERHDCYFVCCDINHLIPINEISRTAGDLAIIEAMNRMNNAAGEDDVVFRIGGDEFVLLTNSSDIAYAESIASKIEALNGNPILFEDKEIPLSLYIAITRLNDGPNIKYIEMYGRFQEVINEMKRREVGN